jgi:peptide/nickel transport system permease protein
MARFVTRRIAGALLLVVLVSLLTFLIFAVMPSADPAELRAGRTPTPALVAQIRHNLGLDRPLYEQYWSYLKDLVTKFDLGYSYRNGIGVREQILRRLPATAALVLGAMAIWLTAGIAIGTVSAVRARTKLDRALMGGALVFISTPSYWLGLVALYLFSSDIGVVPIFKGADSYVPPSAGLGRWAGSLLLPWLVLAATYAAIYARYVRSSLREVLAEDYIRTARAKGAPERRVIVRHGLHAALTPVVTLLALDLGALLGGVILIETVFNIPGVGRLGYEGVVHADLPMIQGMALFGAIFVIVANLVADLAYAFLDPRVRYS